MGVNRIGKLCSSTKTFNLNRAVHGMAPISIECLLVLNDTRPEAIEILKEHMQPLLAAATDACQELHIQVEYLARPFEEAYPTIKEFLKRNQYRNVLFNLDQCGHRHVERGTIVDIIESFKSAEIFYTFSIASLIAFFAKI